MILPAMFGLAINYIKQIVIEKRTKYEDVEDKLLPSQKVGYVCQYLEKLQKEKP